MSTWADLTRNVAGVFSNTTPRQDYFVSYHAQQLAGTYRQQRNITPEQWRAFAEQLMQQPRRWPKVLDLPPGV